MSLCIFFVAATSQNPPIATSIVLGICSATMAVQTMIDLTTRRLPLPISLSASLLMILAGGLVTRSAAQLLAMVSGGIAMMAIAHILVKVSRGSLGRGDVYFCLPLGVALGIGSNVLDTLSNAAYAWAITALIGGVTACGGMLLRRVSKRSTIPYGPFLVVGTIAMLAIRGTP